ncbi:inactive peptidyl-prolyl cis-trans isomerase shutdown [Anastrepha ludens]|uniref:inactive peptidyl-prolyl cis-trans isomerase shutdown n=1 Tax=Anastrepha ludens TaxID=28586 RepID=UPI0023B04755|nr:inactive peptidyl-prolyl cis-trans isomerase shutdown [Anastrepha ludens]
MDEMNKLEDDSIPSSCNFLKDPLSIGDLIGPGTTFEINTNFDEGFSNDIFEELNLGSDEEDDAKTALDRSALVSPWTKSFDELRQQMGKVNEHIYKKVTQPGFAEYGEVPLNARVCIRYNAYWEREGAPFDSSFLRGSSYNFYTGRHEVIEGLEEAVRTMHRGEQAQFVISYHLLFREIGCPPRVKPRADALFIIELVSFNPVGDLDADQNLSAEERGRYAAVIDKIRDVHLKGLDFFGQGLHKNACRAFEKAVNMLNSCHLANDQEQREQTAFLLKLYTNLAVCYNKVNLPAKACIMCKEIRQLTENKPSCKALFQEGRALLLLGEYERARHILIRAQRMEPQNEDISKEMKLLEERYARYKENERGIWTKAMGIIKLNEGGKEADGVNDESRSIFEQEMAELMKSFKNNMDLNNFNLPTGLTKAEIKTVDELARSMELKLTLSPLDNTTYTLSKVNKN